MKNDKILMKIVYCLLAVSSLSLMLATVADFKGEPFKVFLAYATGVIFWLFLILGYVVFYKINKHRKEYEKTQVRESDRETRRKNRETNKKPGIICFFSNKYAVIADIVMVVSLVLSLVFLFVPSLSQNAAIIFVSILVLSIHMHGILNGVNFRYISKISK